MNEVHIDDLPLNFKGHACIYAPIFCQEGLCSECQVFRDWFAKHMSEANDHTRNNLSE